MKLKPALILGFMYLLVTFISKLSIALNLGKSAIIVTSLVTGLFDIDPVILSVSTLSASGALPIGEAIVAILLAVAASQITKSFIAISTGSKKFGKVTATMLLTFIVIILLIIGYMKFFYILNQ